VKSPARVSKNKLSPEKIKKLNSRHLRAAFIRSIASLSGLAFALIAFSMDVIKTHQFIGISVSILYLVLINFPALIALKRISSERSYNSFSLLINQLEILGYTSIIYFCGDIEATHLTLIYAALIAYVGVVAPQRHCFIVASLCVTTYFLMLVLIQIGFIPHLGVISKSSPQFIYQFVTFLVVIALLYTVAFISATSASLIKKNKDHLEQQNKDFAETNEKLMREIQLRKQTADALQESEYRYRTLTNNLNVGVYRNTVGPKGKFIEANPAIVKIFGFQSKDEFLAVDVANLYQNPNDRSLFNKKMLEKGFVNNEELNLRKKDGTPIIGSVSSVVVKNESGNVKYYDGIIEDISERKRLEIQLQQAQKMEAIGTLAGGIAHDFNNLLMTIQGNASLIHCDIDSKNAHVQSLINIENAVNSGAKLTRQLLGYARKGKYQVDPICLNQLIEETANTLSRARKNITVHCDLSEDLKAILADQGQIEQVLLNLFVNAADAMAAGGDLYLKTVNINHQYIKNSHYFPIPGKYVQLIVRDTGIGMDKKTQDRIFEPFFTTKEMGRGTGLGLASVYGIIKGHGGYIDVESEVGIGTTFKVYLPSSDKKAVKSETKGPDRIINGNGTILLVDDEELVLGTGSKILEKLGYSVLEANGGKKAVEIYKKNKEKIDMVILDMIMPGMGGGKVFDKIKEVNPGAKVLLSSGYSIDGQATEILRRGCDDFIQKPFSINKLSEKISELQRL